MNINFAERDVIFHKRPLNLTTPDIAGDTIGDLIETGIPNKGQE